MTIDVHQQAAAAAAAGGGESVSLSTSVEVVDLHKSFGDVEVIKGISFAAPERAVIALIGASGGGKSTLLRCINLLEVPERGEIFIEGERLPLSPAGKGRKVSDKVALRRIRARLGMVFQRFNLWSHLSVIENIMVAPRRVLGKSVQEARSEAEALLDRVGLLHKADAWTWQLSGGQQQRVSIARALAMSPKVLLFDEPTSALDPELVGEVLAVMGDLAREGRTMLVATHEMEFAREVATHVVYLENGLIGEQGSPQEIMSAPRTEGCRRFLSRVLK